MLVKVMPFLKKSFFQMINVTDCSVNDTLVKVMPFLKKSFFQIINVTDCSVNEMLVKVMPFLKKSFFQMINVTESAAVHSLLPNAQDRRSRRLMVTIYLFVLGNSAIIFLALYFFHS